MKLPRNYIAPPVPLAHIEDDPIWLKKNFRRFLEFFYAEYPAWKYMVKTSPENYRDVAKSKGLPVFKVGLVSGEKIRLKNLETIRIVYVDDGEVAIPLFIVGENGEFIIV